MATISKIYTERLKEIKKSVEESYNYFEKNYARYHEFIKFVFKTSMTDSDIQTLQSLGKPTIEFNILESFVSRLRGEFAKQQPSLSVRAADGVPIELLTDEFSRTLEVIEAHLRAVFFDASNDKLEYNVYSDLLAGGFSVLEIYTDYINEMSLEQNIVVNRVFDPTLCGFDPLARDSHKGDGNYCFQLYPKTKKEFEEEFGKEKMKSISFKSSNIGSFSWSSHDTKEPMIMICDFYEKKNKKTKIVKLRGGKTMTKKEYEEYLLEWEKSGRLEQPLAVVNERTTTIQTIVRYRICESEVLDYKETNYKHLPLVFVDGNSVWITEGKTQYQMTRPYVYHAKGIQRLKNFSGQTLANELENITQVKLFASLPSIPEDYLEAYTNPQKQQTLVYHPYLINSDGTPNFDKPLPPPREMQRTPIPPEVTRTFDMLDNMTQHILGSYDSALGVNSQQISGTAIAMGAMQSNNASVPYLVGYIKGLNRVAQIMVDLIPKYYKTPRSLPVLFPNGKRTYKIINQQDNKNQNEPPLNMDYDPNSLEVKVETGVNFAMQKEMALKTIIGLMQASPAFAQFMNEEGLNALLDNIDIRGIDDLKSKAMEYEKQNKQKQATMQQMQQQIQEMKIKMDLQIGQANVKKTMAEAEKAIKEAKSPTKSQVDIIKIQQEGQFKNVDAQQNQEKIDMELAKLEADLDNVDQEQAMKIAQLDAENARTEVEKIHTLSQVAKTIKEISEQSIG